MTVRFRCTVLSEMTLLSLSSIVATGVAAFLMHEIKEA